MQIYTFVVLECKKKWKYLRDNYNKVVKKQKGKSGKSGKKTKPWEFLNMLSFLNPFVVANVMYVNFTCYIVSLDNLYLH